MSSTQFRLPVLLLNWPWTRRLSPHYEQAKRDSSAWVESFKPFGAKGQRAFNACDLNLLASLAYSARDDPDFIRLGCDLMNFYFVYDEYTDIATPEEAGRLASTVITAMKTPSESEDQHLLVEMTRQFWQRALTLAEPGSTCLEHFITTSELYLHAVTQEAEDRQQNRVRTIADYLPLRRETCGARPSLALYEFGLGLPEEVTSHPIFEALAQDAIDLIIFINDMHSYVREISCGLANHNIITLIMHEYGLGLQEALDWLGTRTEEVIQRFLHNARNVPSWGEEIDSKVQVYIDSLGQWVRGSDDWSCEAKRYHGNDGLRIQDTRLITICPRKANYVKEDEAGNEVAEEKAHLEGKSKAPGTSGEAKGGSVTQQSCSNWVVSEKYQIPTHVPAAAVDWFTDKVKFWWKSFSVSLRKFFHGPRPLRT
ncbi:hypothetical protein CVT24_011639 [Panaeolus cyanescens]|uniref:Terpene synthase n=1 Tax=Panaeolus cyanescens TaxID=181874 RepID=A0A409YH01_9AGAR|nr:hypothetical protein CVT24_011639 [Panaeolus cyanescens]